MSEFFTGPVGPTRELRTPEQLLEDKGGCDIHQAMLIADFQRAAEAITENLNFASPETVGFAKLHALAARVLEVEARL